MNKAVCWVIAVFLMASMCWGQTSSQPINSGQSTSVTVSLPASMTVSQPLKSGAATVTSTEGSSENYVVYEAVPSAVALQGDSIIPLAEDYIWWEWDTSISIPDYAAWVQINCNIGSGVPSGPYVTKVAVHHEITHPNAGDLEVKVFNEQTSHVWMVRDNEDDGQVDINETRTQLTLFDNDDPNQTWYYSVQDNVSGNSGTLDLMQLYVYFDTTGSTDPDLIPYQPIISETSMDWNDKIPISTTQLSGSENHSDTGPYSEDQTLYINWASLNQGDDDTLPYTIRLEITGDGGGTYEWSGIQTSYGYYTYLTTDYAVGPLAAGEHTFKLWLDYYDETTESNESNNYYERTITVNALQPGEIHGMKFNDLNGDGVKDAEEPGLENWLIYLDLNTNGQWDNDEPNTLTASDGSYAFVDLAPGTYTVAEVPQTDWEQTYPGGIEVNSLAVQAIPAITYTGSSKHIAVQGEVVSPTPGQIAPMLAQSGPLVNMDAFRSDARFSSIDGAGYAAVIIDTGIDLTHPFFGPDSNSDGVDDRIVYQYDFGDNDSDASDFHGHGSNVASIVASQDSTYTGMAPGCNIIALKVFSDSGTGDFGMTESALQWCVNNAVAYNITSINMSLGESDPPQNYTTPQTGSNISDELAALKAMGVIICCSAGNDFYTFDSEMGVNYPAADVSALAVGAVYDSGSSGYSYGSGAIAYSTGADRICPFSQRHPDMITVFAPGAPITGANREHLISPTITFHGTSQASPHIAGIAVIAQQVADTYLGRHLTQDEFAGLLDSTGVTIYDGDDEDDNVTNTGEYFKRVDMLALANGIVAMGLPGTHVVNLDSAEVVTDIDFGNHYIPVCGDWGYLPADADHSCTVDIDDYAILSSQWLEGDCASTDNCYGADMDIDGPGPEEPDGQVDLRDFARLFIDWMQCTDPTGVDCYNLTLPCGAWGYYLGDVDQNCYVDVDDLSELSAQWRFDGTCTELDNNWCNHADTNQDGDVNLEDFAQIVIDWLNCTDPADPAQCDNLL